MYVNYRDQFTRHYKDVRSIVIDHAVWFFKCFFQEHWSQMNIDLFLNIFSKK